MPETTPFEAGTPAAKIGAVREQIRQAAVRSGRDADSVRLLAVVKFQPPEAVRAVIDAGVHLLGGNYVQETSDLRSELGDPPGVEWHLIGGLQSNKARAALRTFDVVQTVDRVELARRLGRIAREEGKTLPVLVQVDLAGTAGRSGADPESWERVCDAVASEDGLELRGLMGVPPPGDGPEAARPHFARLREWFDKMPAAHRHELSMGMSSDYTVAVEEGSTLVRIGSALFGPRPAKGQ